MREFISDLRFNSNLFIADYDSYSIEKYKTIAPRECMEFTGRLYVLT